MKRPLNFVVIATLSIFLILRIAALVVHGFSWTHVIWAHVYLLGLGLAIVWEFKARPGAPDAPPSLQGDDIASNDPPLISLVLLAAEPKPLEEEELQARLVERLGDALEYVEAHDQMTFVVRVDDQSFRVLNSSSPYVQDRQTEAMAAATPQLADAIRRHEAWRSVDQLDETTHTDRSATYAILGRVLAELVRDAQPLAVFCPETGKMTPWRGGMVDDLRDATKVMAFR